MCTGLIKNVIGRYSFNGSNVFGCFLDVSKAFDQVFHLKLFSKPSREKYPSNSWSSDCSSHVTGIKTPQFSGIAKTLSDNFSVSKGVRQGGVLLPILFQRRIYEKLVWVTSRCKTALCAGGILNHTYFYGRPCLLIFLIKHRQLQVLPSTQGLSGSLKYLSARYSAAAS